MFGKTKQKYIGQKIQMFNAVGQLVYKEQNNNSVLIPTDKLQQGIYFLEYNCNGRNKVEKIIIH